MFILHFLYICYSVIIMYIDRKITYVIVIALTSLVFATISYAMNETKTIGHDVSTTKGKTFDILIEVTSHIDGNYTIVLKNHTWFTYPEGNVRCVFIPVGLTESFLFRARSKNNTPEGIYTISYSVFLENNLTGEGNISVYIKATKDSLCSAYIIPLIIIPTYMYLLLWRVDHVPPNIHRKCYVTRH